MAGNGLKKFGKSRILNDENWQDKVWDKNLQIEDASPPLPSGGLYRKLGKSSACLLSLQTKPENESAKESCGLRQKVSDWTKLEKMSTIRAGKPIGEQKTEASPAHGRVWGGSRPSRQ